MDSTSIRQILNNYVLSELEKNRLIQELEILIKEELVKEMKKIFEEWIRKMTNIPEKEKCMNHDYCKGGTSTPSLQDSELDKNDLGLHTPHSDSRNITFSDNDRQIQETAEQNQRNAETSTYTDTVLPPSKTIKIKDIKTNEEETK